MECIINNDLSSTNRIHQLARNVKYFRKRLKQLGFVVYGHHDSPVVPIKFFIPTKVHAFVVQCLQRGVATVGAAFPATKIAEERVRFCITAGHTKTILDNALEVIDTVGGYINCKHSKQLSNEKEIVY